MMILHLPVAIRFVIVLVSDCSFAKIDHVGLEMTNGPFSAICYSLCSC